ncbi:unnamed protein product [Schistosoma mattheei]|uniref:Uncharacterized protein n=1 Tax=Schistosoma mattheei TaxID=31246 RepID=A0A183P5L8_9TREM|nr:unnamed protein product [Schistosoma mattheei]
MAVVGSQQEIPDLEFVPLGTHQQGLFKCKRLGESCRRTIFYRCCGDATCQSNGSKGKCVPSLRVDRSCWRNIVVVEDVTILSVESLKIEI